MIHILQIDTSGNESMVALSSDGILKSCVSRSDTRDHAAVIHDMVAEALASAAVGFTDLGAVSVCAGPGSYTGLRIGMAVAKGFCYALGIPLLLQNRLELMVHQHMVAGHGQAGIGYLAVLPARTGEYFAACYTHTLQPVLEPKHMLVSELLQWLADTPGQVEVLSGSDNGDLSAHIAGAHTLINVPKTDAAAWGKLAFRDLAAHKIADPVSAEPFYMKEVFINKKL